MRVHEDWRYCPHCELPGLPPEQHECKFCLRDERDEQ